MSEVQTGKRPLNALEISELLDCASGVDIRSSDRLKDRAKQELRRRGLIAYMGAPKRWSVTYTGRQLVEEHASRPSPERRA
jgi:hypothetical protein